MVTMVTRVLPPSEATHEQHSRQRVHRQKKKTKSISFGIITSSVPKCWEAVTEWERTLPDTPAVCREVHTRPPAATATDGGPGSVALEHDGTHAPACRRAPAPPLPGRGGA